MICVNTSDDIVNPCPNKAIFIIKSLRMVIFMYFKANKGRPNTPLMIEKIRKALTELRDKKSTKNEPIVSPAIIMA